MNLELLSRKIKKTFRRIAGPSGSVEDCVQGVLCEMLAGGHKKSTIEQAIIDFLRKESGRKDSPSYLTRLRLNNPDVYGVIRSNHDFAKIIEIKMTSEHYLNLIKDRIDRGCFVLYYKWQLTEPEIGEIFGFSQERVHQRLKRVLEFLNEVDK